MDALVQCMNSACTSSKIILGLTDHPKKHFYTNPVEEEKIITKYSTTARVTRSGGRRETTKKRSIEFLTLDSNDEDFWINRKEGEERTKYTRKPRSGGKGVSKKKTGENNLLLVYPFEYDAAVLSQAAANLTELGGNLMGEEPGPLASTDVVSDSRKLSSRTHYTIISEEDKDRLLPGQFFNDTLVDFWMLW